MNIINMSISYVSSSFVRNIEIKDKIAKINEENNGQDKENLERDDDENN